MTAARVALRRDQLSHAGYAGLITWAWFLYGFGALLPLLRTEQGTSRAVLGLHSLALAVGGGAAGLLAVAVVRRFRRRGAFTLAALLITTGMVGLVLAPGPWLSVPAVAVVGVGGAMLVNAAMPALSDHHGPAGPAALSEANAAAAAVGLLAPLAVGAGVALGVGWRPAALLVIPLAGVQLLLVRRVPAATAALDGELVDRSTPRVPLPAAAWVLIALVMTSGAIEFCCTAWSADLLRTRNGMSPGAASAGVTAVVAGMAAGRFVIGRLALRTSARRLLLGALLLTGAGWLVLWFATGPAPALVGLVLVGLGLAGQYPLGTSLLLAAVPGQGDQAIGALALWISTAAGLAPFGLGALADVTSTHTAFLVVPALVGVALVALALSAPSRPATGSTSGPVNPLA